MHGEKLYQQILKKNANSKRWKLNETISNNFPKIKRKVKLINGKFLLKKK